MGRQTEQVLWLRSGADPMILTAARDCAAPAVTRDTFRDWVGGGPEIAQAGFLISGGYDGVRLRLHLPG